MSSISLLAVSRRAKLLSILHRSSKEFTRPFSLLSSTTFNLPRDRGCTSILSSEVTCPSPPTCRTFSNNQNDDDRKNDEFLQNELGITNNRILTSNKNNFSTNNEGLTNNKQRTEPRVNGENSKRRRRPRNKSMYNNTDIHYPQNHYGMNGRKAIGQMQQKQQDIFVQNYPQKNDNYRGNYSSNSFNNSEYLDYDGGIRSRIRVKSVHIALKIDEMNIISKVFGSKATMAAATASSSSNNINTENQISSNNKNSWLKNIAPVQYRFGKISVVIELPPAFDSSDSGPLNISHMDDDRKRYVVIFRFGSVVFFNVSPRETQYIIEEIKKYSTDPISSGFEQKEHFEVAICPGLDMLKSMNVTAHKNFNGTSNNTDNMNDCFRQFQPHEVVNADFATVKKLDMNNVGIISKVIAQSVAMDYYGIIVDELLAKFAAVNTAVNKQGGQFTEMERNTLFQVVAQNNSIFIDMVSKLGVMDRSDTAWNFSQYEGIFEGMRNEFEIQERFEQIEFKLNLIQQNAKFFLEVFQDQKSTFLEWVIILLITFECGLMILEMSGYGEIIFSNLMNGTPATSITSNTPYAISTPVIDDATTTNSGASEPVSTSMFSTSYYTDFDTTNNASHKK